MNKKVIKHLIKVK